MRYTSGVGEEHTLHVPAEAAGARLDVFLSERFQDTSRTFIRRLIDDELVQVDPGKTKASHRLRGGERIVVFLPEPVELSAEPEAIPLSVLFEDEYLIVIDKPPGMVVHPSPGHESGTLVNALLHHCSDLSGIGGVLRPGIVHRLDRDTSGCLVAAKTDVAHQWLVAQFSNRSVEKTYLAITEGVPQPAKGTVTGLIGRHPVHRQRQAMLEQGGRHSHTDYRTLENLRTHACVECDLHTGRTHQIRVHLKHRHAPILCDADYGRGGVFPRNGEAVLSRQALHARRLGFRHPATGAWLRLEAPLPGDMAAALAFLRGEGG